MKNWDYFCDHPKPLIYVYPNAILPKPSKVGGGTCWQGLNTAFLCKICQSSATNTWSRNPVLLRWGISPFAEAKRNGPQVTTSAVKLSFVPLGKTTGSGGLEGKHILWAEKTRGKIQGPWEKRIKAPSGNLFSAWYKLKLRWLIFCVPLTRPQATQLWGQTLFWVFLRGCFCMSLTFKWI